MDGVAWLRLRYAALVALSATMCVCAWMLLVLSEDCWEPVQVRGMDPIEAEVRDGFVVEAPDGTKFEDGLCPHDP